MWNTFSTLFPCGCLRNAVPLQRQNEKKHEKEDNWNHRCLVGVGLDELHRLELTGFAAETIT